MNGRVYLNRRTDQSRLFYKIVHTPGVIQNILVTGKTQDSGLITPSDEKRFWLKGRVAVRGKGGSGGRSLPFCVGTINSQTKALDQRLQTVRYLTCLTGQCKYLN